MSDSIYGDKKIMSVEDDPLKILKFFATDLLGYKIVKILLLLTFSIHTCVTFLTIYFFTQGLTKHEVMCYSPISIGASYPLMTIVAFFCKGDFAKNVRNEVSLWAIDSAGKQAYSTIRREAKIIEAYTCTVIIFINLGTLLYIKEEPLDMDYIFALRLFRERFPEYSTILIFIYKSTFIFMGYSVAITCFQMMYLTEHYKFQMILFENNITNIGNGDFWENKDLMYSKDYQREVKRRMILCIQRTQEYIESTTSKVRYLSDMIVFCSVTGVLVGICIAFTILSENIIQEHSYTRLGATLIIACLIFCGMAWSGQAVESQFEKLGILFLEICWYEFDNDNKKLYLIFLTNIMKERKIQFSENYSANYQLGLAVVRAIYSVSSTFLAIKF